MYEHIPKSRNSWRGGRVGHYMLVWISSKNLVDYNQTESIMPGMPKGTAPRWRLAIVRSRRKRGHPK
jgi:hypothetical protein